MYIKDSFKLMKVGIQNIVVATGEEEESFNGMIRLNSTGVFLWEKLTQDHSENNLVDALMKEYGIDEATAKKGVDNFLASLKKEGVLGEDE